MHRGLTISLVVPAHNEEAALPHVLGRVPSAIDEVVVVDNLSTDRTAVVAASLGARVVPCDRRGYGNAYLAGLPAARGDVVLTADADATYPVDDVCRILDHFLEHDLDFLTCSRFPHARLVMPWTVRMGNRFMTALANRLYGCAMHDLLSGMWMMRRDVIPQLQLTSGNWNLSEEIKLEAWANPALRFGELPVAYGARIGRSKVAHLAVVWDNAAFLLVKRRHCLARFAREAWGSGRPAREVVPAE